MSSEVAAAMLVALIAASATISAIRAVRAGRLGIRTVALAVITVALVAGCAFMGGQGRVVYVLGQDGRYEVSCGTFDDDVCLDLAGSDATEYLRLNPGFSVMSVEVRRADESTEGWVCGRRPKAPGFETVCQLIEPT